MNTNITNIITAMRDQYLAEGRARAPYYINDGLCEDFAMDVIKQMGGETDQLFAIGGENFMIDCEEWDWPLLKKHWGIRRPMIFTKAEFDEIPFGSHVFIASGKRFYDAECAEGVDDFFNLPIFRRSIIRALQEKGIILDAQDIQLMQDTQAILKAHPPKPRPRRLEIADSPEP